MPPPSRGGGVWRPFVSILAQLQPRKLLPGGGVWNRSSNYKDDYYHHDGYHYYHHYCYCEFAIIMIMITISIVMIIMMMTAVIAILII